MEKIISLGSINLDLEVRTARWPEPGETLIGSDFLMIGGGKGANVALIAKVLGAECMLLGRVGRDALGEIALAGLEQAGVDISGVIRTADAPTGVAMISVRPDGEKTIVVAENANGNWSGTDAARAIEEIEQADPKSILVVDGELSFNVLEKALIAAEKNGMRVVLDPSPADRIDGRILPRVSFLVPNSGEAEQLTGVVVASPGDALIAAERLREKGVRAALVKLQDGGVAVVSEGLRTVLAPPPRVEVVDKTGAGDAFAGGLAVALLEGRPLDQAARFAAACAAVAVTRYGAQPSYVSRSEIDPIEGAISSLM